MSRYIVESITTDCMMLLPREPLSTVYKLQVLQCETGYIANTDQWCIIYVNYALCLILPVICKVT